jgi:hypothetical protein
MQNFMKLAPLPEVWVLKQSVDSIPRAITVPPFAPGKLLSRSKDKRAMMTAKNPAEMV